MKTGCKNCSDRTVGCHINCERYAEFVSANEAVKQAKIHENLKEGIAAEHGIRAGKSGRLIEKRRRGY